MIGEIYEMLNLVRGQKPKLSTQNDHHEVVRKVNQWLLKTHINIIISTDRHWTIINRKSIYTFPAPSPTTSNFLNLKKKTIENTSDGFYIFFLFFIFFFTSVIFFTMRGVFFIPRLISLTLYVWTSSTNYYTLTFLFFFFFYTCIPVVSISSK